MSRAARHWVVGDVHGHHRALEALLQEIDLNPRRDRLWLVGDVVNRGPDSAHVLRRLMALEETMGGRLVSVLGNHDVHLLAVAEGLAEVRPRDTVQDVLDAPDACRLLEWLGRRPVLHREGNHLLVHAGLQPSWTVAEAEALARRVEERLANPRARRWLFPPRHALDHEVPRGTGDGGDCRATLRRAFQTFIRLRTLTPDGELCDFSGPLEELPEGCTPWFRMPRRRSRGTTVLCGHWAALGLHRESGVIALDSGCAWGGCLTALRVDDPGLAGNGGKAGEDGGDEPGDGRRGTEQEILPEDLLARVPCRPAV